MRYADDMVILCRGNTQPPMVILRDGLARLGLTRNETKRRVVDAPDEAFDFVGFRFAVRRSRRSGRSYPHVEPSRAAIQRIKDRTKALTDQRRTAVPMPAVIAELNRYKLPTRTVWRSAKALYGKTVRTV